MNNRSALLVLDMQVNMFEAQPPLARAEELLATVQGLRAAARTAGAPIIYVRHNGGPGEPDEPGTPGWQIHPALAPNPEDLILDKRQPDAFAGTPLQQELAARGIERIVLAGLQTDMCINASCRRARELGYTVTLVADAHSTYDDGNTSAMTIIDRHNRELSTLAQVVPAGAVEW
jgi:nicotinamidase-related amidase